MESKNRKQLGATASLNDFLDKIEHKSVLGLLRDSEKPLYEITVWNSAFPDIGFPDNPLLFFRCHFALFHFLALEKRDAHHEGWYLHLDCMRLNLLPYPRREECRHYYDEAGDFCRAPVAEARLYCARHRPEAASLSTGLARAAFYLNEDNFYLLDEEKARRFVEGSWEILYGQDTLRKAYAELELPADSPPDIVKKRYRELARRFHPDSSGKNRDKFQRIQQAYSELKRVFAFFS